MIRNATTSDILRIAELLYQVHAVHANLRPDIFKLGARKYQDNELKEIIANPQSPVFVYQDNAGIVQGYAFCLFQHTEASASVHTRKVLYLDDLCVDASQRGKKIGEQLYQHILKFAKENQYDSLTLHVWNDNSAALRFYERLAEKPLKTLLEHKLR